MTNDTLKHAKDKMKKLAEQAANQYNKVFHKKEIQKEAQDQMKRAAARAALAFIEDDMVLGVGMGSTVEFFIEELKAVKGRIEGVVASSIDTERKIKALGIPLIDLNSVSHLP